MHGVWRRAAGLAKYTALYGNGRQIFEIAYLNASPVTSCQRLPQ